MTISNVEFLTHLYSKQCKDAVIKDGVKAEAILTQPFSINFDWNGFRWRLTIPAGYEYAPSIPAIARSLAPATGSAQWAAVPHDWIYQHASIPRKDADKLYALIMATLGERPAYRRRQYWAVRVFGWIPWKRHGHEGGVTLKGMTKL